MLRLMEAAAVLILSTPAHQSWDSAPHIAATGCGHRRGP
jgi:hypothetical protein